MAILEPRLKELTGASRLALGFFNSLIRRIECTKPIDGDGIKCLQKPDGIQINLQSNNTVVVNVCSSGQPFKIALYYDPIKTKELNT